MSLDTRLFGVLVCGAILGIAPASAGANSIVSTLDATAPAQSEQYFAQTTGQVLGQRLLRNGVRSTCGVAKPNPGGSGILGPFRYDAYTFTALETKCQLVRLRRTATTGNIHLHLYSVFNPADATTNYLADSGASAVAAEGTVFAFDAVAGQTYTIVVINVTPAQEGAAYELVLDDRLTTRNTSTLDPTSPTNQGPFAGEFTNTSADLPLMAAPASACGAAETAPPTTGTGPFRYDALTVITPISTCLTVTLRRLGASGSLGVAAYSELFNGAFNTGWLADSGAFTSGAPGTAVSFSMLVTAGQLFNLVVYNLTASQEGVQYELELSSPVQPPRLFRTTSVAGNTVTFRWLPPLHGPTPSDYAIDGGLTPGQVLATVPLGSQNPLATLNAPSGAFYVRARSLIGGATSTPSNETRIFVNQAVAPSTPSQLLATVSGSSVGLSWENTFDAGTPTALALDVTGSATASIPLSTSLESIAFAGVPGGAYTLRLRATNASGSSAASTAVNVAIPGVCSGVPQPPANFLAYRVGNAVTVVWDAPATGPAPTSYTLLVSGSFVGAFSTAERTLGGSVGAGSYTLAVQSNHGCGSSVATAGQTIVVP